MRQTTPDDTSARWRRRALFGVLYLSEGAPIGFLWWALPTRLRESGVPLAEVTALTALLAIPWTLKFLWAPALDLLRGPRWGYRQWLLAAQTVMGLSLLPLAWLDFNAWFGWVFALCVVHAFAAATQDVAIDALAIASTEPDERGTLTGWMQVGMLLGRSVFGGGVLWLGASLGQGVVVAGLVGVLALVGAVGASANLVEPAREDADPHTSHVGQFARQLAHALWRREVGLGLAFAALAGCGFEACAGVLGPFLVDHGFSSQDVGAFLALPAVASMGGGALLGGALADRVGRTRAVAYWLAVLALTVGGVAGVDAAAGAGALQLRLGLFYGCIGGFTASSYALFMDLTSKDVAATQFTAFMALTNACEAWAVLAVGRLALRLGSTGALLALAGLSLLALPLLLPLRRAIANGERAAGEG